MSKKEPKEQSKKPRKDKAEGAAPEAPAGKAAKPKGPSEPSRLRVRYSKEIIPALMKHFGYEKLIAELIEECRLLTLEHTVSPEQRVAAACNTNTLVIEYEDGDSTRTIHLTLGQRGLQTLKDQVNRADQKTSVLEELQGKTNIPLLVAGTEWAD